MHVLNFIVNLYPVHLHGVIIASYCDRNLRIHDEIFFNVQQYLEPILKTQEKPISA